MWLPALRSWFLSLDPRASPPGSMWLLTFNSRIMVLYLILCHYLSTLVLLLWRCHARCVEEEEKGGGRGKSGRAAVLRHKIHHPPSAYLNTWSINESVSQVWSSCLMLLWRSEPDPGDKGWAAARQRTVHRRQQEPQRLERRHSQQLNWSKPLVWYWIIHVDNIQERRIQYNYWKQVNPGMMFRLMFTSLITTIQCSKHTFSSWTKINIILKKVCYYRQTYEIKRIKSTTIRLQICWLKSQPFDINFLWSILKQTKNNIPGVTRKWMRVYYKLIFLLFPSYYY